MSFGGRAATSHDGRMLGRAVVTVLLFALFAVLPAACSGLATGACDDYHQGQYRAESSSCTADGMLATKRATGCENPGGVTYATTTTACSSGEHCVADSFAETAACLRTCATDADCQLPERPWCRSGSCVPLLAAGSSCSNARCAAGLSCAPGSTADAVDAGDAGPAYCDEGHPASRDCRCR